MTNLKYAFIRRCDNPYCNNDVGSVIKHCCKTCYILSHYPEIRNKLKYLNVQIDGNDSFLPLIVNLVKSKHNMNISSCIKLK